MISIHALLAESDNFLLDLHLGGYKISIHALLAESDNTGQPVRGLPSYFYPRSPCGERHILPFVKTPPTQDFYPRSPCGERHSCNLRYTDTDYFYPRSPCGERHYRRRPQRSTAYFYPRSPCGERQQHELGDRHHKKFLSTLSLRRATTTVLH